MRRNDNRCGNLSCQRGSSTLGSPPRPGFFIHPFYESDQFSTSRVFAGTSVAVLFYIGFDAVSTLSEEVENPRRNISLQQCWCALPRESFPVLKFMQPNLIWGSKPFPSDQVESAFSLVSRQAGGLILFQIVQFHTAYREHGLGIVHATRRGAKLLLRNGSWECPS